MNIKKTIALVFYFTTHTISSMEVYNFSKKDITNKKYKGPEIVQNTTLSAVPEYFKFQEMQRTQSTPLEKVAAPENAPAKSIPNDQTTTQSTSTKLNLRDSSSSSEKQPVEKKVTLVNKIEDKTVSKIKSLTEKLIAKKTHLVAQVNIQDQCVELITSNIENLLFSLLNISAEKPREAQSLDSLKKEIQYLAEQIQTYNTTSVYNNKIDLMVALISSINNFLQDNMTVSQYVIMNENINNAYQTASSTSNLFALKNIILDVDLVPDAIKEIFIQPVLFNKNAANISNSNLMLTAMYGKDGSIEQILRCWDTYLSSNKQIPNSINSLYYAAFMTFILIFQDSIAAITPILNEMNNQYKVTDTIKITPVTYTPQPTVIPAATLPTPTFYLPFSTLNSAA